VDLKVHTTHAAAHAATALRHAAACVLLRHFGHHGFGGNQESRDGRRILDRHTHNLGWIDDALGDQVDVFAGANTRVGELRWKQCPRMLSTTGSAMARSDWQQATVAAKATKDRD
jgi:hypothetical protein